MLARQIYNSRRRINSDWESFVEHTGKVIDGYLHFLRSDQSGLNSGDTVVVRYGGKEWETATQAMLAGPINTTPKFALVLRFGDTKAPREVSCEVEVKGVLNEWQKTWKVEGNEINTSEEPLVTAIIVAWKQSLTASPRVRRGTLKISGSIAGLLDGVPVSSVAWGCILDGVPDAFSHTAAPALAEAVSEATGAPVDPATVRVWSTLTVEGSVHATFLVVG